MPTSGRPGAITGQATKSSTVSEFLSNAYTALELAIKLAPLIPVPFVSSMLASAQVIVDAANVSHTLPNYVLHYIRLRGADTFLYARTCTTISCSPLNWPSSQHS
jgi:hypothetical protein